LVVEIGSRTGRRHKRGMAKKKWTVHVNAIVLILFVFISVIFVRYKAQIRPVHFIDMNRRRLAHQSDEEEDSSSDFSYSESEETANHDDNNKV
jgi:hypothetical protein